MGKLYATIFLLFSMVFVANANQSSVAFSYNIYPNPLNGNSFQVSFDPTNYKSNGVYKFTLSNIIGQNIYNYTPTELELKGGKFTVILEDLKLDKGVYLTKFEFNQISSVQKLVVR